MPDADPAHTPRLPRWPGPALALCVMLLSGLIIASGRSGPSEAGDQDKYHLVVIEGMIDQWPAIDIVNYPSATSPGYHALMAAVAQAFPENSRLPGMRWLNAVIGSMIPWWCYVVARRFASPARALAVSLPVALNSYVIGGSAYLTTDNAGLLLALLAVGLVVGWPLTNSRVLLAGGLATLAVGTRQVHLWVAGVPLVAALMTFPAVRRWVRGGFPDAPPPGNPCPYRLTLWGVVALVVPLALVGWFVVIWGGLVPPAYASMHDQGPNPAGPAFALGLVGVIASALTLVSTPLWRPDAYRTRAALVGALAGLIAALAVPTSFHMKERALGWMWHAVWFSPTVSDRSVLLVVLAPLGGAAGAMLVSAARRRGHGPAALTVLVALAGWLAAQSMNSMAWQRYFEPILLVMIAWLAVMGIPSPDDEKHWARPRFPVLALFERAWWVGPAALAVIELGVTAVTLFREVLTAPPVHF